MVASLSLDQSAPLWHFRAGTRDGAGARIVDATSPTILDADQRFRLSTAPARVLLLSHIWWTARTASFCL